MNRILIIDDNHSFVDTVQVMLKDMGFLFESASRYTDAETLMVNAGTWVNHVEVERIIEFQKKVNADSQLRKKNPDAEIPELEPPVLEGELENEKGFTLVIVEQNTESGLKGIDFIQNILRLPHGYTIGDFLLLTGNIGNVEAKAESIHLAVMEKPVRTNQIRAFVQSKLSSLREKLQTAEKLKAELALTVAPKPAAVKEPKSSATKTSSPKKTTAKKATSKTNSKPAVKKKSTSKSAPKTDKKQD